MLQNDYNDEYLSVQLRNLIMDAGHNMSSFAKEAGLPESTIRNLCDIRTPFNPNAKTLVKMAAVLDRPISDILNSNCRH